MSGIVKITSGSETDLLSAVANVGPVAVAMDGRSNAFRVSPSCDSNSVARPHTCSKQIQRLCVQLVAIELNPFAPVPCTYRASQPNSSYTTYTHNVPQCYHLNISFAAVLLQWSVRLLKMFQQQDQPCHGGHWLWLLQWKEVLAGQEQVHTKYTVTVACL